MWICHRTLRTHGFAPTSVHFARRVWMAYFKMSAQTAAADLNGAPCALRPRIALALALTISPHLIAE